VDALREMRKQISSKGKKKKTLRCRFKNVTGSNQMIKSKTMEPFEAITLTRILLVPCTKFECFVSNF
jgi:hypothetical protein